MIEKIKFDAWKTLAILPLVGVILIIISLFTPFAISEGLEGITISSQSNVWYWGFYQEQDQLFYLHVPFMLTIFLPMITAVSTVLILIFSVEFGLNKLKRKLYGEILFIFSVLIYFSISLTIRLIEYSFSLMPDLEPYYGRYAPFGEYRIAGFGTFGINIAIFLVLTGSIISLSKSRKSFFYIEITVIVIWIFFFQPLSIPF